MKQALQIIQIIVSLILIGCILVQHKGVGLSGVFGGEGNVYRTKRGLERVLFYVTILFGLMVCALSITLVLI